MKQNKETPNTLEIITIVLGILALAILFNSCSTTKQTKSQKVNFSQGVEIKQDSTKHIWEVHTITLYDSGRINSVDQKEKHVITEVIKHHRDTTVLVVRDTLYIDKDAVPVVQTAKHTSNAIWGIVSILLLLFVLFLYWRYRRK